MSIAASAPASLINIEQVAVRFGPLPWARLVFDPEPGTATEIDVLKLYHQRDWLCELVDGVLVRKPTGSFESFIAVELLVQLHQFVSTRHLGWILGADGFLRLRPGRIRVPDVSFISREQTPNGKFPRQQAIASLFPDLAVEVLSDSNTAAEMNDKRLDDFTAGTRSVWIIQPLTQTAEVWTSPQHMMTIPADGILTAHAVLPGLAIPLAPIFAAVDLRESADNHRQGDL